MFLCTSQMGGSNVSKVTCLHLSAHLSGTGPQHVCVCVFVSITGTIAVPFLKCSGPSLQVGEPGEDPHALTRAAQREWWKLGGCRWTEPLSLMDGTGLHWPHHVVTAYRCSPIMFISPSLQQWMTHTCFQSNRALEAIHPHTHLSPVKQTAVAHPFITVWVAVTLYTSFDQRTGGTYTDNRLDKGPSCLSGSLELYGSKPADFLFSCCLLHLHSSVVLGEMSRRRMQFCWDGVKMDLVLLPWPRCLQLPICVQ